MAMDTIFIDGFDHIASSGAHNGKWDSTGSQIVYSTSGYGGGGCLNAFNGGNYVTKYFSPVTDYRTIYIGWWIYVPNVAVTDITGPLHIYGNGTDAQLTLYLWNSKYYLKRGTQAGTTIGTGTTTLLNSQWYHLELYAYIDSASGEFELKLDGVTEFSGTGVNTQDNAENYWRGIALGGPGYGSDHLHDHLFIRADTVKPATPADEFLGLCKVATKWPDANGTHRDFTPSTGTDDFAVLDETYASGADYVSSSTATDKVTVSMQDQTGGKTLHAVALTNAVATDQLTRKFKNVCRSNSVDYVDTTEHLTGTSNRYYQTVWQDNPNTSTAWTDTTLNAAEWGVENQ